VALTRRNVRYLCFRLRTEAEGGNAAPELPEGFKETFEEQENFRGWAAFGVSWDVDENDQWLAVILKESLARQWERTLLQKVPVFPGLEELDKNGRQSIIRPDNEGNQSD
jgi:hypothetical protein